MEHVIGIDGGGTSSRLRISDINGREIYFSTGLSTNIYAEDEKAIINIQNIIKNALSETNINSNSIKAICLGSAGLGMGRRNDDERAINAIKQILPNSKIKITTDAHILLTGAIGNENGMILIAGTGSVAIGRNNGKLLRAGGLGWRLGDEGSAWWVSKEAIYKVYAQYEKRDYLNYNDTSLLTSLLSYFKLEKIEDFVALLNSNETTKSYIAKGAKVVSENAKRGELISLNILKDASKELVKLVQSIVLRLGETDYSLVLYGGEFEHDEILKDFFIKELERFPRVKIIEAKGSALDGAITEAIALL